MIFGESRVEPNSQSISYLLVLVLNEHTGIPTSHVSESERRVKQRVTIRSLKAINLDYKIGWLFSTCTNLFFSIQVRVTRIDL